MKSFRDRNPYAVGLVSVLIIGAITGVAETAPVAPGDVVKVQRSVSLVEVPEEIRSGLTINLVETIDEVIALALQEQRAKALVHRIEDDDSASCRTALPGIAECRQRGPMRGMLEISGHAHITGPWLGLPAQVNVTNAEGANDAASIQGSSCPRTGSSRKG